MEHRYSKFKKNKINIAEFCMFVPENITEYYKTCFQNPWTLHEYLQIFAMKHPLEDFE